MSSFAKAGLVDRWPDLKTYETQAKLLLSRFEEQAEKLGIEPGAFFPRRLGLDTL